MANEDNVADAAALRTWYEFASHQEGFVGSLLCLLRERQGRSVQEQQVELGIDDTAFTRLQGMPLPRSNSFASDAMRIAEACGLPSPFTLVQLLVLARNLAANSPFGVSNQAYQAAFDLTDDLDESQQE